MDVFLLSASHGELPDGVEDGLQAEGLSVRTASYPGHKWSDATINWGYTGPMSRSCHVVVNPARAVSAAKSTEETARLLSLHGIPVPDHAMPHGTVRRIRPAYNGDYETMSVHVADLTVIKTKRSGQKVALSKQKLDRVLETACRSVYLMGLHFGEVHLLLSPNGEAIVSHIDPAPVVSSDLGFAYGSQIGRSLLGWLNDSMLPVPLLGADPEFTLTSRSGRAIDVSQYVDSDGTIGYDSLSFHDRHQRQVDLHRIGAVHPVVEVRPAPDPSPIVLAHRIQEAMEQATDVLPVRGAKWTAGSFPFGLVPIGGHIHFSGIPLTTPLLKAFDAYVAIPLMLVERRIPAKRRRRRYGRLGDFRRKDHGGFEYRTLSSWLVSPQATVATLSLAKVVVNEWRHLPKNPWTEPNVAREFYLSKKIRFQRTFRSFWNNLQQTESGGRYEKQLDYIRHMVTTRQEWDEEADLKHVW